MINCVIIHVFLLGLILVGWGTDIGLLLGDTPTNITAFRPTNIIIGQNITFNILKYASEPTASLHFYKWTALVTVLGSILLDFSSDNCQTPARTFLLDTCLAGKCKINFEKGSVFLKIPKLIIFVFQKIIQKV